MDRQNEILKLLNNSTISAHHKKMIQILLPVMEVGEQNKIYDALVRERDKLQALGQKAERIEMKYRVMAEKLVDIESKK